MTEFLNKNLDAELILGREVAEVNDRLANVESYEEIVRIIEVYLWKRVRQIKEINHPVDKIGELIIQNPQGFSLDEFAKEACLSNSQLERRFVQQIGVPPKFFARVCRFYQAFVMKERTPSLKWLHIALENGYTDYQHLVRDFKEFSGSTPKLLLVEECLSPERILGLNPGFTVY